MNKISTTKVGDLVNFIVNGTESQGIIAKMSNTYVTIFKEDGKFYDVPLNDTFYIKDILINKTWNEMNIEERTDMLVKARAYSPRYLSKSWEQLPRELQSVLKKGAPVNLKINPLDDRDDPNEDKGTQRRVGQSGNASARQDYGKLEPDFMSGDKHSKEHDIPKYLEGKTPLGKSMSKLQKSLELLKYRSDNIREEHGKPPQGLDHSLVPASDFQSSKPDHDGKTTVPANYLSNEKPKTKIPKGGEEPKIKLNNRRFKKSDVEQGAYGNIGGRPHVGISTHTEEDADDDYEGQSHERTTQDKNEFQHEEKKPQVTKENAVSTSGDTGVNPIYGKPKKEEKMKTGEFVYTENPPKYKIKGIPDDITSTYGIRYTSKEGFTNEKGITKPTESKTTPGREDITQKKRIKTPEESENDLNYRAI